MSGVPRVKSMNWREVGHQVDNLLRRWCPEALQRPMVVPVDEFIEWRVEEFGMEFHVDDRLPPGVEAAVDPITKEVLLTPLAFENLNQPHYRFTAAHEIGHIVLHVDQIKERFEDSFGPKLFRRSQLKAYEDPEVQANAFASALLMPTTVVKSMDSPNARMLTDAFGVSYSAASLRLAKLKMF